MPVDHEEAPKGLFAAERAGISSTELVVMIAGLMALNALAIDIMLPALPALGADLGVADPNHRQYVVMVYVFGLGAAQLIVGPISDRFGRRMPLVLSLVGYALCGLGCVFADTFTQMLVARGFQGVAASGARVISLSIVRDVTSGRSMAKLMSLVMMVFMAVPILAPNIGQLILLVASWRWTFGVLVVFGFGMALWVGLRLRETLPLESRAQVRMRSLLRAYKRVLTTRVTAGYMLAAGVIFGALFAFISSSEQLFVGVFEKQETFTLYFAGVAAGMAVSSFVNARLVERLGMRRLSHAAVLAFVCFSGAYVTALHFGVDGFIPFYAAMILSFFCFSMIGANFNALAMEPLGDIAGTASSALGFSATLLAGALGAVIGQSFDGTVMPIAQGFLALGVVTLAIVLVTERGRLLRA
ncbi:MAG: multidrug effflux MFS transporter [Nannocystaceae bacterium]